MASPQPSKKNPNKIEPINPDRGLLKFNLFLTDSIGENVSFAVIPQSHRVSRAYKELLYANLVNFQKHHWISEFKSILKDSLIKQKMISKVGKSCLNNFLLNIDFNEEADTSKFDIPLKFMDLVIFDEHTFHRAKSPKNSSRFIFRFCYGRKKIYST